MSGTVFIEQLKRSWLAMLGWGLGLASLMLFLTAILQNDEVIEQYARILGSLPEGVLQAFGVSSVELLTTANGFIAFAGFTYGALILSVYGVLAGLDITANDEDEGSLNVLLSMPIARWQIIVEKYLAQSLLLLGIVSLLFLGIVVGANIFNVSVDFNIMLLGTLNLVPLSLAIMAMTCLIASLISRKVIVSGLAAVIVAMSYFINILTGDIDFEVAPIAAVFQKLSVFSYVDSEGLVTSGALNPLNLSLLLGLSIVMIFAATFAFNRRDIGG